MNRCINRLQRGLAGIVLPALIVVSGCSVNLQLGNYAPVDLSKSKYASEIEIKSDELAKSYSLEDKEEAVKGYGSIGKLEKMDEVIKSVIRKSINEGLNCSNIGEKYHKLHKK